VIVELGFGVLAVGAAGYALRMLCGRKAMFRSKMASISLKTEKHSS